MTMLQNAPRSRTHPSRNLRATMAAMRLSFTWFGVRKTLSAEQKARAADAFDAQGEFLSAGKKLIDTRQPQFRAVTSVRHRTASYWRAISLPFPEPGIRLVRQQELDAVNVRMTEFRDELLEAVETLNTHFDDLQSAARERLGRLYSASDYPETLIGLFDIAWEFPSVEPPNYLQQLSPDLYDAECQRVQARFDEAVQLAEQAFLSELAGLVGHLTERLSGSDDGKPKVFRDSAIENLTEFFERFKKLNIRSNGQLDDLVNQAQEIVQGVEPQPLRDNPDLRQQVTRQLAGVQSALDGLLVDRPRRNIIRRPR